MIDFFVTSPKCALIGDFPLKFDTGIFVKSTDGKQVFLCHSDQAEDLCRIIRNIISVRYVKIVSVEDFDDSLC